MLPVGVVTTIMAFDPRLGGIYVNYTVPFTSSRQTP